MPTIILASGCSADGNGPAVDGGDDGTTTTDQPSGEGICLMNNCNTDEQCLGCGDGRTSCLVEENRCVACDPVTGMGCEDGIQPCSSFGICAPDGQICPTDDHGEPTISCSKNTDCLACSPMNQVCDAGKCVACTGSNTQHCLASDICVNDQCSAKCPNACAVDNDCGQCGAPGAEAHACNSHKCSECSATYPCAAGLECIGGTCVPGCGTPDSQSSGSCLANGDCQFCGDPNDTNNGSWECKKPINANGPNDHGTCGPVAAGCSDLGSQVAVLPQPWSQVTNLCSNDNDCNGVGIQLDVGQMVKDIIGDDEINLGFTKVAIKSALVNYDMGECADIDITQNISCGVCVPCKVDSDCEPIGIDPLIMQMFAGEPLAQIAGALLIDLLFGDNEDHNINFQCLPVAAGYGVCAPCSNPLQACGSNQGGGNNQSSGSCNHGVCDIGGALTSSCSSCSSTVCTADPYCCNNSWDTTCVNEAQQMCGTNACGGGGNGQCSHSECVSGGALTTSCSTCASDVCNSDAFCCNTNWDGICVQEAESMCSSCGGNNPPPQNSCVHGECAEGDALNASCSSCATDVCNQDSYCCNYAWDSICTDMADSLCGGCY